VTHLTSSALEQLLDELVRDPDSFPSLTALSDLPRGAAEFLRSRWTELPEDVRVKVMERAVEAAIVDFGLDFTELALAGTTDPAPAVRLRAISGLAEATRPAFALCLLHLVRNDPDEQVRVAAINSISRFVLLREFEQFDSALGDDIVECLFAIASELDEEVEVRAAAIAALGFRTDHRTDGLIEDSYADEDATIHVGALRAMGNSAHEKWLEYLFEQMQVADSEFRIEAATAVGAIGSEDGIDALKDLLSDDDLDVVAIAIAALVEIGGEEGLRALEESFSLIPDDLSLEYETAMQTIKDAMDEDEGGS
jgi:HEAT repeat protein